MGTVFLTNLAAVAGKYERYDVLSAIMDFETHNRLPLEKLRLLKTLKKTLMKAKISTTSHLKKKKNWNEKDIHIKTKGKWQRFMKIHCKRGLIFWNYVIVSTRCRPKYVYLSTRACEMLDINWDSDWETHQFSVDFPQTPSLTLGEALQSWAQNQD